MTTTPAATTAALRRVPTVAADPPTGPTGQPRNVPPHPRRVQVTGPRLPLLDSGSGGDWTELIELPDGALGVLAAGGQGHDRAGADAMGLVRARLRARALQGWGPSGVLDDVDQLVQSVDRIPRASALYGRLVLDRDGAMLRYTNAGHLRRQRAGCADPAMTRPPPAGRGRHPPRP